MSAPQDLDRLARASAHLGIGLGVLFEARAADPEAASDIYQQALALIPREEIDKYLAERPA